MKLGLILCLWEAVERFNITPAIVATELVKQLVFFIVVGFTLPIRSICWTLWYKNLYIPSSVEVVEKKKKSSKKASAKTFKIEKRGIDPEIIRRARLEDDEY